MHTHFPPLPRTQSAHTNDMIAFIERFLPDNDDSTEDNPTATTTTPIHPNTNTDLVPALRALDLLHCSISDHSFATRDFGRLHPSHPAAVLRPTTADEVSRVVRLALSSPSLTLVARGNGHSVAGQSLADFSGVVLDMSGFNDVDVSPSGDSALVGAGALWEQVLERAVQVCRRAPRSWTDYLGLTVGGTLSNGGVSGQAFRHGPQTSNVEELEVVTGNGDVVLCSESVESDLFFSVLGGLGQFGVVTRARIPLYPAPDMVRMTRLVYTEFEQYAADAEFLVSRDDPVDYVEGFVFVNSDDPVNGWDSVPLSSDLRFDPSRIPDGSGPVLYCLEFVLYYNYHPQGDASEATEQTPTVDKRIGEILKELRHVRGLEFNMDVGYVEFLTRVKRAEEAAKANGTWETPHPWLNLLVSSDNIVDFDLNIFKKMLRKGIDGPMLVYPLLKSKWDPRTSEAVPEGDIFYLVALLRFCRPFPDGRSAKDLLAQNQEIIDHCVTNGYDFKVYIPQYKSAVQWEQHFGKEWSRFVERKARYDPMAILAPGQKIFPRACGST